LFSFVCFSYTWARSSFSSSFPARQYTLPKIIAAIQQQLTNRMLVVAACLAALATLKIYFDATTTINGI
jgi:hypothetical protein